MMSYLFAFVRQNKPTALSQMLIGGRAMYIHDTPQSQKHQKNIYSLNVFTNLFSCFPLYIFLNFID